ncbi:MAG: NAD(P)/FAD-dependent oxidoreductase [Proteobacteria bacterium]|nr:NAD(P)/FAD-dependent oxidoreductase [Pseudomonadota bacterium]
MNNDNGMMGKLTRRDFINGIALLGVGGLASPVDLLTNVTGQKPGGIVYPPALTGLRGSQSGSFEVAHAVALSPDRNFGTVVGPEEEYDLVVIGAGISGLSAAHFYRETIKPDARILILDNHDDFGGHARRDEFSVAGKTYITYGGSQSIDGPSDYSNVSLKLLRDLGVDLKAFETTYDRDFFRHNALSVGIFFDATTFGKSILLLSGLPDQRSVAGYSSSLMGGLCAPPDFASQLEKMPLTDAQRAKLSEVLAVPEKAKEFFQGQDGENRFWSTNYVQFLRSVYGIEDVALLKLLSLPSAEDSALGGNMISLEEAIYQQLLGLPPRAFFRRWVGKSKDKSVDDYIYHFPDGNATVARLLAQRLLPGVARFQTPEESMTVRLDYQQLDVPNQPVRLRLNSTAILAENTTDGTRVRYVQQGALREACARHTVMAGWHIMAAHIVPELPERQKAAMRANLKLPLIYAQVALRQWQAVQRSGVGYVYCPGSYFQFVQTDFPVSLGGFQPKRTPADPMTLLLIRLPCPFFVNGTMEELTRQGRSEIMVTTFEQYEQQIRLQLTLMFGAHGFDPDRDIEAITVNRWPHGYVWDGAEFEGKPAHLLARQPHGRIVFANADSAGSAYMDDAIVMAWRAVNSLKKTG